MRDKSFSLVISVLIVALLVSIAYLPVVTKAAEVWSDNFDDKNYDGWTVRYGSFSCKNKMLESTYDSTPNGDTESFDNAIWRKSNVSYGTWSFDFYWGGQTFWGPTFFFVVDELDIDGLAPGGSCFALQLETLGARTSWDFMYIYGFGFEDPDFIGYDIEVWDAPYGVNAWRHVVITLKEYSSNFNEFTLYINGTRIGDITWAPEEGKIESQYFFMAMNNGSKLDNFVVSDTINPPTIETSSTTTTTTETITTESTTSISPTGTTDGAFPIELVTIGAVIVVIIVVIGFKMKRS